MQDAAYSPAINCAGALPIYWATGTPSNAHSVIDLEKALAQDMDLGEIVSASSPVAYVRYALMLVYASTGDNWVN